MPFLVFDVDGVTLDYQTGYREFLKKTFSISENPKEIHVTPKDADWQFLNSKEIGELKPLIDPAEFNRVTQGAKILFVTNLPTHLKGLREKNLRNLGFQFEEVIMAGFETYGEENYPTKGQILLNHIGRFERFCFVDDYPENCDEVAMDFPKSKVLMLQGYYDTPPGHLRFEKVKDWPALKPILINFITHFSSKKEME